MSTSQHRFYAPQYARRRQQSQAAAPAASVPPPLCRAASFFMSRAASLPRNPRWSDVKWNFLGNTRYLMPSAAAAVGQPQRTRLAVSNMVKPTIQFIRGVDELSVPDVALTRSKDGLNGVATFTFDQPSVFDSSKELGDITGLYLVDEEGVLTSVDVSAKFLNGKPAKIEAKYLMKNVSEWDRFMRFMERYAAANNLGFVKK